MINDLDQDLIRYVIKRERKKKKLVLEDLKDKNISTATISYIEKGEKVSEEKFNYLLSKLGLDQSKLKKYVAEEEENIQELKFQLEFIEAMLDNGDIDAVMNQLDKIRVEDFHPLAPNTYFLKGRCYYTEKEWKKAEQNFSHAIHICHQHFLNPKDNIIALCYKQLSSCSYNQNDLEKALYYLDQGLEEFSENKGKSDVKYTLLSNKIYYLLLSSQTEQAKQLLNEVWPLIQQIELTRVVLDLYKLRSILLRKSKLYLEAIECCKEGIRKGRRSLFASRTYDLILVLGSIYLQQKDFNKANQYFHMVINLDKRFKFPRRHLDAHTYLGVQHSSQHQWGLASDHLDKAIKIGREINDVYRLARALIIRGICELKQENFQDAVPYFLESINLTKESLYKHRQVKALFFLAECYDKMNLTEEFFKSTQQLFYLLKELKVEGDDDDLYEV
jgi:tetratricopeptide (TPR) repeat protein